MPLFWCLPLIAHMVAWGCSLSLMCIMINGTTSFPSCVSLLVLPGDEFCFYVAGISWPSTEQILCSICLWPPVWIGMDRYSLLSSQVGWFSSMTCSALSTFKPCAFQSMASGIGFAWLLLALALLTRRFHWFRLYSWFVTCTRSDW